jgi:signal transduction histidine kinase
MGTVANSIKVGGLRQATTARSASAADSLESVSQAKICLMRLALALSALVIIYIDPSEPNRFGTHTYSALLIYTIYSGVLYLAARREVSWVSSPFWTWSDVGCYLVLIALSSGTGSIFFFFFFFAILVASFRDGYEGGMRVTVVSTVLFAAVGYYASLPYDFELNRLLLRPIYLLILGYMIAVWGGSELTMKRRLALLKRLSGTANPRLSADQTIGVLLEEIRKFFDAETCVLVTQSQETMEYCLRRADGYKADRAAVAESVTREIGCQLISLLGDESLAVSVDPGGGAPRRKVVVAGDEDPNAGVKWEATLEGLTPLIGDDSFMSVPWHERNRSAARLYLTARAHGFSRSDLEFLSQVEEHANPLIENVKLLDRLASVAAEHERRRISRDLHDGTIQPYIGLRMGLESICRKASAENPLAGDLKELLMRTEIGLADLRLYVHGLKQGADGREEPALASAVRQYAEQFTLLYGVEVACEVKPGLAVNDRLSAEAFQIVREGLSNVYRHTRARAAAVRLSTRAGSLVVEVENDAADEPSPRVTFTPRSIRERSEALGGKALVDVNGDRTLVRAEIPL